MPSWESLRRVRGSRDAERSGRSRSRRREGIDRVEGILAPLEASVTEQDEGETRSRPGAGRAAIRRRPTGLWAREREARLVRFSRPPERAETKPDRVALGRRRYPPARLGRRPRGGKGLECPERRR